MLLLCDDESDTLDVPPLDESAGEPPTLDHLSLHAFHGSQGLCTIRFCGSVLGTSVQIIFFFDGVSSDNFVHPRLV